MWKTQRYKSYGMTIDTNSYEKTQTVMKYQEALGLPLPTYGGERERVHIAYHKISTMKHEKSTNS